MGTRLGTVLGTQLGTVLGTDLGGGGSSPPAPVVFYAARGINATNRFATPVDGGEPGLLQGNPWGMVRVFAITAMPASVRYLAQRGGQGVSNNGWMEWLQANLHRGFLYNGSAFVAGPNHIFGTADINAIQVTGMQYQTTGAIRRYAGYTQIGPDSSVMVYSPATGTPQYMGPAASNSGQDYDLIAEFSYSGELDITNWCNLVDYILSTGDIPTSLGAYGVTMRHDYSFTRATVGGTVNPTTIVDATGGSNMTRSGSSITVQTYTDAPYQWGDGAEDVWAAFGDSINVGTGLDATLPVDFPNATTQAGTLWLGDGTTDANTSWLQLREVVNQVGFADMFAFRRSQITSSPVGVVNGAVSGSNTTHWMNDTSSYRTNFVNKVNRCMAKNPRASLKFICSLGTNGMSNPTPPDWLPMMESIMGSILSALTIPIASPDVYVVYYILKPTPPSNGLSPGWASQRLMQIAMDGTTSAVGGKTIHWIGAYKDDNDMAADEIHPLTPGYDQVGSNGATAATGIP